MHNMTKFVFDELFYSIEVKKFKEGRIVLTFVSLLRERIFARSFSEKRCISCLTEIDEE
jgi:hypothetical protein